MNSIKVLSDSNPNAIRNDSNQNKIELLNCKFGSHNCKNHLFLINQKYSKAHLHHKEKDYLNSIRALKDAFYVASELDDEPCSKCSVFFRSSLTESLEIINEELHKLTTGFFRKKRYEVSYIESCVILDEFRKNT